MTTSPHPDFSSERKLIKRWVVATAILAAAISPGRSSANDEAYPDMDTASSPSSFSPASSETSAIEFPVSSTFLTRESKSTLDSLALRIDSRAKTDRLTKIEITGSASIDGPEALNDRLARSRAKTVHTYLYNNPASPLEGYSISSLGENWLLLRTLVTDDDTFPKRLRVLSILDSGDSPEIKERKLRSIPDVWRHLCLHQFPRMRKADVSVYWLNSPVITETVTFTSAPELSEIPESTDSLSLFAPNVPPRIDPGPQAICEDTTLSKPSPWTRHYYIKTNLPAWLCLWANLEGEADMAPHWSADLSVYYSGLNYFSRTLKFRTFSVMPEIRYWFSRNNDGLFAGAHFGLAYYNVALNGENRYQDHNGTTPALGGGITLGFRLPLRNRRWKMEFSAGAGIYHLDYDIFDNRTDGLLTGRRKRTFYGLDRVAVSICHTFGPSYSGKKGGDR